MLLLLLLLLIGVALLLQLVLVLPLSIQRIVGERYWTIGGLCGRSELLPD